MTPFFLKLSTISRTSSTFALTCAGCVYSDLFLDIVNLPSKTKLQYTYSLLSGMLEKMIVEFLQDGKEVFAEDIAVEVKSGLDKVVPSLTKLESKGILTRSFENRYKLISNLL